MCDDSDPQWVSFSSKQKQKCLASMNKLIATSGQDGAYEFVDPLHVRCNLCVANGLDPHICNPRGVHGVGAIVSLSKRKFCVDSIVTTAKSQAGHHHTQHGSMQKSSKKMKRQQQDLEAAATWKAVYNLGGHHHRCANILQQSPSLRLLS